MSAEDKSETLSIVSSNRSTINISSDSTERIETPPIATSPTVTVSTGNGIENKGFVQDEKKNGEFEAVNLELVDLNKSSAPLSEPRVYEPPSQPQPPATQKFSDYYVSVNEHKKGLRGEKLYVTKDSRRGRGCKRYCCAFLVLLVIAATVTIASLVGTGVIDTQPKFKGEITKSGRSRDLPPTNDSLTSGPPIPVIDNHLENDVVEENEILPRDAVPNVLEGQMSITNAAWDNRLSNSSNPFFKDFAKKVESALYPIFVTPMKEERADFFLNVNEFERKDGVTPHFRLGWELKDSSFSDGIELMTKDEMSEMLMEYLKSNDDRLTNVFKVPLDSIRVKRVADDQCSRMDCQSFCSYNYPSNAFQCGCSHSFKLAEDGKTCIEDSTDPTSDVNLLHAFDLTTESSTSNDNVVENANQEIANQNTNENGKTMEGSTEKSSLIEDKEYSNKVPRLLNTSTLQVPNNNNDETQNKDQQANEWKNSGFPVLGTFNVSDNSSQSMNELNEEQKENTALNKKKFENENENQKVFLDKNIVVANNSKSDQQNNKNENPNKIMNDNDMNTSEPNDESPIGVSLSEDMKLTTDTSMMEVKFNETEDNLNDDMKKESNKQNNLFFSNTDTLNVQDQSMEKNIENSNGSLVNGKISNVNQSNEQVIELPSKSDNATDGETKKIDNDVFVEVSTHSINEDQEVTTVPASIKDESTIEWKNEEIPNSNENSKQRHSIQASPILNDQNNQHNEKSTPASSDKKENSTIVWQNVVDEEKTLSKDNLDQEDKKNDQTTQPSSNDDTNDIMKDKKMAKDVEIKIMNNENENINEAVASQKPIIEDTSSDSKLEPSANDTSISNEESKSAVTATRIIDNSEETSTQVSNVELNVASSSDPTINKGDAETEYINNNSDNTNKDEKSTYVDVENSQTIEKAGDKEDDLKMKEKEDDMSSQDLQNGNESIIQETVPIHDSEEPEQIDTHIARDAANETKDEMILTNDHDHIGTKSSIEGHYHGDVFHAGFHEDERFLNASDLNSHENGNIHVLTNEESSSTESIDSKITPTIQTEIPLESNFAKKVNDDLESSTSTENSVVHDESYLQDNSQPTKNDQSEEVKIEIATETNHNQDNISEGITKNSVKDDNSQLNDMSKDENGKLLEKSDKEMFTSQATPEDNVEVQIDLDNAQNNNNELNPADATSKSLNNSLDELSSTTNTPVDGIEIVDALLKNGQNKKNEDTSTEVISTEKDFLEVSTEKIILKEKEENQVVTNPPLPDSEITQEIQTSTTKDPVILDVSNPSSEATTINSVVDEVHSKSLMSNEESESKVTTSIPTLEETTIQFTQIHPESNIKINDSNQLNFSLDPSKNDTMTETPQLDITLKEQDNNVKHPLNSTEVVTEINNADDIIEHSKINHVDSSNIDQSTEKIREDIFRDLVHKFADGVKNINFNSNNDNASSIAESSEKSGAFNNPNNASSSDDNETKNDMKNDITNNSDKAESPRHFDATDILNKVGNIIIQSDNDKNETKSRIAGSLGINDESKNGLDQDSNDLSGINQNVFINGSIDPELIQNIILKNVLKNNQSLPFHQDSLPYQIGLPYPNGTEAIFNFNATTLDASLLPTLFNNNDTHEALNDSNDLREHIASNKQSNNKKQIIFGGFQFPNGTKIDLTSNASSNLLLSHGAFPKENGSNINGQIQILPQFVFPNGTYAVLNKSEVEQLLLQNIFSHNENGSNRMNAKNKEDIQKILLNEIITSGGKKINATFTGVPFPLNETEINQLLLNHVLTQNKNGSIPNFVHPNEDDISKLVLNQILSSKEENGSSIFPPEHFPLNETEIQELLLNDLIAKNGSNFEIAGQIIPSIEDILVLKDNITQDNQTAQELNLLKEIVLGHIETTTEKDMGNITEIHTKSMKKDSQEFEILSGADFSSQILGRSQKNSRKISDLFDGECKDPQNEFMCIGQGVCLPKHLRCNGIYDCRDGSDELLCEENGFEKEECKEFQCRNGPCIQSERVCDGQIDCPNAFDELDCHSTSNNCTENEFYCVKDARCIPLSYKCNGISDCVREDEDERNCDCDPDFEFKCIFGGGCIDLESVCDGFEDCPDLSDEFNCLRNTPEGEIQIRDMNGTLSTICFNNKTSLAQTVCQQLGYGNANIDNSVLSDVKVSYYKGIKSNFTNKDLTKVDNSLLEDINSCENNPKIMCEKLECSNKTLSESQKEALITQGSINISSLTSENELWPSLAYLFNVKKKTSCVVTILKPKWLITSYSCMNERSMDPLEWVAFVGHANGQTDKSKAQIKVVKRIISNPSVRFQQGYYTNDLALIELNDAIEFNEYVQPICLENPSVKNELCFMAGWTDVNKEGVSFRQYFDWISLPLMPIEECNSQNHYNDLLNKNSLCTSSKHRDVPCRADSGAPLLCYQGDRWTLRGVLSREGECLASSHPDIFTSVKNWETWINSVIGNEEY